MIRARALWLLAALVLAPLAQAQQACPLGRGWPPATENYGTVVENLLGSNAPAAWRVTRLPVNGKESGLILFPGVNGGDWKLRYAKVAERVHAWGPVQLELRTSKAPELREVPMPADVATRLLEGWRGVLDKAAPAGSEAPFGGDDTWLFVAGDLRVSGLTPKCALGELMIEQLDLLVEATDEGPEKRQKRWRQVEQLLDRMEGVADAQASVTAE